VRGTVTNPTQLTYLATTRVINIPLEPGANHSDLPEDLQFLPEFKNGKPYKRYSRLYQNFAACKILKFPSTETFGRLDGNGHISTLLTDGPNPSSYVKSLHPNVGIFLC
jgi:hypothetical protein